MNTYFKLQSYSYALILNKKKITDINRNFISRIVRWQSGVGLSCRKSTNGLGENKAFPSTYIPQDVEGGWYNWWEERGYFQSTDKPSYTIILPPPNVTGTLHLGHALTTTIQDVLVRWKRMQGLSVLWIPGTDHAGIATQVVVEKKLWQDKAQTRHGIGRERFVEEVWKWKHEKGDLITKQLRILGATLDWSKEYFTMDANQSVAVTEAFIRLFNLGLIYRTSALVNWSCVLQSAISDIEVDFVEISGPTMLSIPGYQQPVEFGVLTNFAYKLIDSDGEIVVSTTRLETMLGDVAIAVHPSDDRYKHLHGLLVWHPFRDQAIPIICDDFVDPLFGTGAVKITPAHDHKDFEVMKRHNLDMISVITEEGKINNECGIFAGLLRFDARKAIADELDKLCLLRGKTEHSMQVPVCSRSGDVIETLLKPQWFINCRDMAKQAVTAVQDNKLKIEPHGFEKTWFNWLLNIRDWCVSRQIWWGHRIPMYECCLDGNSNTSLWIAARSTEEARQTAITKMNLKGETLHRLKIKQDEDVLDTWFSSALLPFSAFGWPLQTDNLQKHYPLSLMETGHDILFFWVARMVMLGTQLTGHLPFKKILLHGIICDAHGRKMSKSLGNVISPDNIISGISLEDLHKQAQSSYASGVMTKAGLEKTLASQKKLFPNGIPECGTDALRFTLCSHNIKNHLINFDVNECHTNRLFCNKIWQASKYVKLAEEKFPVDSVIVASKENLSNFDRWILSRLSFMVTEVNRGLECNDLHTATAALKSFIYYDFCDNYLESTKSILRNSEGPCGKVTCNTLLMCLEVSLRALSPFMPFLSEELYKQLTLNTLYDSIMIAPYPSHNEWTKWRDEHLEEEVNAVFEIIATIRHLKTNYNITKQKAIVHIVSSNHLVLHLYAEVIKTLGNCLELTIIEEASDELRKHSVAQTVGRISTVHLIVKGFNLLEDQTKLTNKKERLLKDMKKLIKITSSHGYKLKASSQVQKSHLEKIQALQAELGRLEEIQESLENVNNSR